MGFSGLHDGIGRTLAGNGAVACRDFQPPAFREIRYGREPQADEPYLAAAGA